MGFLGSWRSGKTIAFPIENTDKETLQGAILEHVEVGSQVMTDEASGYAGMDGLFFYHATVNHGAGEYKRGGVHTNGIESVWSLLKRGVYGTWHHISPKHIGRYVDEVTFRLNAGNVARHTLDRLDSFVKAVDGAIDWGYILSKGDVILESASDNSIPYGFFSEIENAFGNVTRRHLG